MSDKQLVAWLGGGAAVVVLLIAIFLPKVLAQRQATEMANASAVPTAPSSPPPPPTQPVPPSPTIRPHAAPVAPFPRPAIATPTRQTVAPPPPPPPPAPPMPNATLSGGVWVTRQSGSSDLMRGVGVYVLRRTVPAKLVVASIDRGIKEQEAEAARCRKEAATAFSGDFWRDEAKLYDRRVEKLKAIRASMLRDTDLLDLHRLSKEVTLGSSQAIPLPADELLVAEGKTSIDGKYRIESIPPGLYYVYAFEGTRAFWIDWLVPVEIKGKDVALDLFNDNAATIRNSR